MNYFGCWPKADFKSWESLLGACHQGSHKGLCLVSCSPAAVLKFIIIFSSKKTHTVICGRGPNSVSYPDSVLQMTKLWPTSPAQDSHSRELPWTPLSSPGSCSQPPPPSFTSPARPAPVNRIMAVPLSSWAEAKETGSSVSTGPGAWHVLHIGT